VAVAPSSLHPGDWQTRNIFLFVLVLAEVMGVGGGGVDDSASTDINIELLFWSNTNCNMMRSGTSDIVEIAVIIPDQ